MKVHVLGCGSAMPTPWHRPSCQVLEQGRGLMMIDCGEGAQSAFREARLSYARLRRIFISHLHGDHCLGLVGMLSTMSLQEIHGTVEIYMHPEGIRLFKEQLDFFCKERSFNIEWHELKPYGASEVIYEDKKIEITAFRLDHRVPCTGFRFQEKPKERHLRADKLEQYEVPIAKRPLIKLGANLTLPDGTVISNEELTTAPHPSLSYAYCSDTVPSHAVARACHDVTLMYHEATYDDSLADKASQRGHSTASQAGEIAREARAAALMIGHYSKRYHDTSLLAAQASSTFHGPVIAAQEGMTIDISTLSP